MEYDISVKKNEAFLYIPQDSLKSQDTLHKQSKVRTKYVCTYVDIVMIIFSRRIYGKL